MAGAAGITAVKSYRDTKVQHVRELKGLSRVSYAVQIRSVATAHIQNIKDRRSYAGSSKLVHTSSLCLTVYDPNCQHACTSEQPEAFQNIYSWGSALATVCQRCSDLKNVHVKVHYVKVGRQRQHAYLSQPQVTADSQQVVGKAAT
eukprot:scaffold132911_cov15-Tisochrysis_lutea.AAC.1